MTDIVSSDIRTRLATSRGYRYYVLAALIVVYIFNFLDRQIIGILAGPIKADLGLTDTQLGLMGGLAFALFYTGLGIPIAMLADRKSRSWIMTISLVLWSGFTALCGLATSFWQLFLCRLGVGVGEAGGVAPSYSLIADYFPPEERGRALAAYSFAIPIGTASGILFGGILASMIDWRAAFIIVGLAGILIAPIFRLTVREPVRGRFDPPTAAKIKAPPLGDVLRTLFSKPSFWLLSFGASASSILGYGLAFWMPSLFMRSFGLTLVDTSIYLASIGLIGGLIGIWSGGWLGDRLGASSKSAYAVVPGTAFLLAVPLYAAGIMAPSAQMAFFLFLIPQALGLAWLGPVLSAIQNMVGPSMRATTSACFLFINNMIGIGFGTVFFGLLSDLLGTRFGAESLRYSMLAGLSFYFIAAGLFFLASRRLGRDWHV